jgi:glycosyltransferase involved in cell wall biosynthesis
LKVAYLINQYPKVSHSFIRREIQALERLGLEVERVALRGWDERLPDPEDQREQARTHYVLKAGLPRLGMATLRLMVRSPSRFMKGLRLAFRMRRQCSTALRYHLVYLAEACYLLSLLERSKSTRLHAHFGTNSAEVAMMTRVLGGPPYSFTAHGQNEFEKPIGLREKVHYADFAVAVCSFGRSQLYLNCNFADWPKMEVVHCGLEKEFYASASVPITDAARIVCVGRLSEEKGQLVLVDAVSRLKAKGLKVELVLAGDGPMRAPIEAMVARYGLNGSVRITGWISSAQVREEILGARAMVLPSFVEGLPVSIMEAMSLRRPVIATYVAGVPELVLNGATGWLVPAGSVSDLAAAIEECVSIPATKLQSMGDSAYARVVERHSIDIEAAKLARLFAGS